MTWRRALIGVLSAAVLLAGGVLVYRQFFAAPEASSSTPVPEAAATAAPAPVIDIGVASVSAEGQIVPLRDAAPAFVAPGVVTEVLAPPGTNVAAGDPILRLDDGDAMAAVRRAEAGLAMAQANQMAAAARLEASRTAVEAAGWGVAAAETQVELASARPQPEAIALGEAQVALAEARLAQATAGQALVLAGAGDAAVRAAEAELRTAEARALAPRLRLEALRAQEEPDVDALAQAERDYGAALAAVEAARTALAEIGDGATDAQRRAAGSGVVAATAQRDAAQAELDLLLAGGQAEAMDIAEAGLAAARAALVEAEAAVSGADAAARQAEADVRAAGSALTVAQAALADRTLNAPFAGIVADLFVTPGEVVVPGAPAAVIADTSVWLVETTDLTERDVVAVAPGADVQLRADALPDETLTGTVTRIAAAAEDVRGDMTYRVTIQLDDAPALPLRWGMTVFVTIAAGE